MPRSEYSVLDFPAKTNLPIPMENASCKLFHIRAWVLPCVSLLRISKAVQMLLPSKLN